MGSVNPGEGPEKGCPTEAFRFDCQGEKPILAGPRVLRPEIPYLEASMSARNRPRRDKSGFAQAPWMQPKNPFAPMETVTPDGMDRIHANSMRILEEIGLHFLDEDALATLKKAGCKVDGECVFMDREWVMEMVGKAPSTFTMHARNPDRNFEMGGNNMNFGYVSSPPNASDMAGGRRPGNFEDFTNLVRLAQTLNIVHFTGGYPVEPCDIPPDSRHLDCNVVLLTETEKVFGAYALGAERIEDAAQMAMIARGVDEDQMRREPSFFTTINTSSPLRVDGPMLRGMKRMAEWGQATLITPFTLSGAMSPVTLAGALSQQNAEALGTIAYLQYIKPGAPCIYGGFTSNVDMKSGAPAFGTPEYFRAQIAGGQLARRYNLPYRSSGVNASNAPDEQSVYEGMMSLWGCALSHTNLFKHSAGWIEGGLCASFEKVILDAEMLTHLALSLRPIPTEDEDLAFDAIQDVGAAGHFFGTQHTMDRYETAFYSPFLSDWRNFETWEEAGALRCADRAHVIYQQLLGDFQAPATDPGMKEELTEYAVKRTAEIEKNGLEV